VLRSLAVILVLATAAAAQSRDSILQAIGSTSGWKPVNPPNQFDQESLPRIAGPAASGILRYGFIGASSQEWTTPQGSVELSIYEMTDPSAAYAIFTLERAASRRHQPISVGTEGFRHTDRSWLWQSRYVISVKGPETPANDLARIVSENILGRSVRPPVVNLLPPSGLVPGSERYVLFAEDVDPTLQLDTAEIGFDDSVEMATATYDADGRRLQLVMLLYPTQQLAKKYLDRWQSEAPEEETFRKRAASVIALIRGTRDSDFAQSILDAVNYETQVTWNEPKPDIALPDLILTIFTFIGFALLFVIVAGISFGGFRVFVKARYPDKIFDRAQDMEIIQLKLNKAVTPRQIGD
jgi:hypothetical protein